ncbi:hypothetical protein, partial [Escherichia coli]|uniref:hypothetical protein n=1 Tax=Escherichia coli TaxID=562 RepID=UPI001BC86DD7
PPFFFQPPPGKPPFLRAWWRGFVVNLHVFGPTPTNTIFYDLFFLDRMPYSMAGYKHWLLTESMYCNVYIFNYL